MKDYWTSGDVRADGDGQRARQGEALASGGHGATRGGEWRGYCLASGKRLPTHGDGCRGDDELERGSTGLIERTAVTGVWEADGACRIRQREGTWADRAAAARRLGRQVTEEREEMVLVRVRGGINKPRKRRSWFCQLRRPNLGPSPRERRGAEDEKE
ncbi:uncharacterized protein A4U43_C05F18970 [Asparagus officinalis]|uniref:Uncharacterized protein n=1 Tax=Asparagus officinalis TaxID=4686 RepID=A0A5P1EY34_ASPOF|nr:uncharacterized protein A4U43_C05F18970 [Asparagus officinalis]